MGQTEITGFISPILQIRKLGLADSKMHAFGGWNCGELSLLGDGSQNPQAGQMGGLRAEQRSLDLAGGGLRWCLRSRLQVKGGDGRLISKGMKE